MDNKPTILIVDDDPKFRKTLSDILRAKGYRAIAVAKGKTALDRVKEEMPAVALIDLNLPDMDGLKMMREIKKRSPDTECIVLTGHASQASVIEAVNLGAYGYMQKPYDMEQLVATIHRAIEKREAEEALRQSEERYRTILDDIEDGYFEVDIAGNFTFFNDSLCRIIGYSRDEMMGMNNRHYMDRENAKKVFQAFNRVYTTGKPTKGFDWEIIRKDGTRRFVEASASPIRGSEGEPIGFRGIVRDITERKRAEEALKASEERYRSLLDGIPVGLYRATPQGQNLDANPAAVHMLGYPDLKSLQAADVADLYVDPEERNRWQALMEQEGVVLDFETQLRRHDGTTISVRENARAVRDADGRILYYEGSLEDITERKRAEEALHHRTEQLEALRQVRLELTAQLDLHALLNSIVSRAVQLLEGNAGGLYLYRPERDILEWAVSIGPNLAPIGTILRRGEGLSGKVWETGEPLIVDDYRRWEGRPAIYEGYPLTAVVGVPVRWGEEFLGVLNVLADTPRTFSPADAELLSLFANQAATAIVNARLYEEAQARSAYLATLLRINATLRSTLPLKQVLEMIVRSTAEALGYLGCFVAMPDARGERLTLGAAWGGRVVDAALKVTRFKLESFSVPVKAQENIIARAFVTGELQTSSGEPEGMAVGAEPPIGAKMAKVIERIAGATGAVCVPLRVAEKTVGVLLVVSPREQLADEERAMLLGLADQAGLAIENARLYEETRRKAEELATLYDVSLDVATQLEIQELLQTILERASRLLNARGGGIYLYDPAKQEIELRASHGYFTKDYIGTRLALGKGLSGKVAQTGEPLVVEDYAHWEGRSLKWDGEPSVTVLGVPLKRGDELLGVLFINHEVEKGFDEGEIRLATLFANQAAIAIENARLYEQARQHTSELSALDLVGLTLTSTRDLFTVLDLIVESCQRLTATPGVHIFLYDQITGEFTHGAGRWDPQQKEPALRMPRKGGMSDTVAKQGKPLVINDARNHPLYSSPEAQSWGINAVAGFPLRGAEALLGVLYVAFFTPHTFVEDELRVLSLLANLATAAIENARSYQSLKKQNLETISALAAAVEAKDPYTSGHSEKVTQFAIAIAAKMGLSNDEIEDLRVVGLLHDIGKIGIPDSVLNKPARLTPAEFLMIKVHPVIAADIVGRIEALTHLVPIIRHHHERWDGDGYPDRLKGEDIPLLARILAVADGFEAMTSERPYRRARTEEEALAELEKGAGSQWDPHVVEVFASMKKEP